MLGLNTPAGLQRPAILIDRVVHFALGQQKTAKVVVSFHILRVYLQCQAKVDDGFSGSKI